MFSDGRILPVFAGIAFPPTPERFWTRVPDANNVVGLTRSDNEMDYAINADAAQNGDKDDFCAYLERLLE